MSAVILKLCFNHLLKMQISWSHHRILNYYVQGEVNAFLISTLEGAQIKKKLISVYFEELEPEEKEYTGQMHMISLIVPLYSWAGYLAIVMIIKYRGHGRCTVFLISFLAAISQHL